MMKLMMAVLFFLSLQGFTKGFAQRISISGEYTLEKALSEIEKQSGHSFFYDYDLLRKAKDVRINLRNASLDEALTAVLSNQPFTYVIQNKTIVLRLRPVQDEARKTTASVPIPPVEVRGKVSSDDGEFLNGAVVNLKGSGKTAVVNARGEFTITIDPAEAALGTLVVTYSGYLRKEVKIGNRKDLQITLEKNVQEMKNVVVTSAYIRPKRKEEVVGSVSTVTAKELQTQRPIESFDKMLEGLAAGVQV
ncbi:MAG TPA: STN and carboxypeptidase regulatory-like domain-containing protein, partial [Flavisolibacter sp.]